MTQVEVRAPTQADRAWLLDANNAAVPNVNHLTSADLAALLNEAALVRVAELDGRPVGAVVAFAPGADYASANYRWFCARYPAFLYVDRVVVDPRARGRGAGRALYAAVIAAADRDHGSRVTCEVNLDPPNPGSMAFHARLGFREVARRDNDGKTVAMLLRGPDAEGA
jgi:hypothetical protein